MWIGFDIVSDLVLDPVKLTRELLRRQSSVMSCNDLLECFCCRFAEPLTDVLVVGEVIKTMIL